MREYDLHKRLGYRVSKLSRIMQSRLERMIADQGLTRLMWCVLTGVGEEGVTTPSELADYVGITRPAISRLLRDMEAKGMLARNGGCEDGRAITISLTDHGVEIMMAARVSVELLNDHFTSKLPPDHLALVLDGIEKLAEGEDERITRL
jgi:MarR family transcriptional regulator, transcriptional regulator for hemolysin